MCADCEEEHGWPPIYFRLLGRRQRFLEGTSCEGERRELFGQSRQPTVGQEGQSQLHPHSGGHCSLPPGSSEGMGKVGGGGMGILAKVATTPSFHLGKER